MVFLHDTLPDSYCDVTTSETSSTVLGTLPRPVVDSVNIESSSTLDNNRWSNCCQEDSMSVQSDEHAYPPN